MTRVLWMAVLLAIAGCGGRKQHLDKHFAQSTVQAFAVQRLERSGAPAAAVTGLDSQEAAIISDAYRSRLAPKGVKVEEEPIILVAPPTRERRYPLAPSVPKE
jgi:hypothetical protein